MLLNTLPNLNTELKTFRCPVCLEIPLIKVILNNNLQTEIISKCSCFEKKTKKFSLNFFIKRFSFDIFNNLKCSNCKNLNFDNISNQKFFYCKQCKNFTCLNCAEIHIYKNNKHILINPYLIENNICDIHYENYFAYCEYCNVNLCNQCILEHRIEKSHKIIFYIEIIKNKYKLKEIEKNFTLAIEKIVEKNEILTQELLNRSECEIDKKDINFLSNKYKKLNCDILNIIKIIINSYKFYNNNKNYNIIMNFNNNIDFDLTLFNYDKEESVYYLIRNYIYFIKHHNILKISDKISFENINEENIKKKGFIENKISSISDYISEYINFIRILNPLNEIKNNNNNDRNNIKENLILFDIIKSKKFLYFGEYKKIPNNTGIIANGRGMQFYTNGYHYYGYFQNGKRNIFGIFYFSKNSYYKGEFKDNKMDGYGIYKYSNGTIYEGEFKNNNKDGICKLILPNGEIFFGTFKNNKINGFGISYQKDGKIYQGMYKNNKKNGFGILYFYYNKEGYMGEFKENNMTGFGKYTYNDKSFYMGEFLNGIKNGFGKYYYNNKIGYEGYFLKGKYEGVGRIRYENDSIYEGYFKNGKRNGFGILIKKNREKYVGYWKDDKRDGFGIFMKDGKIECYGEFKENKKNGFFKDVYGNYIYEGYYEDDNKCLGRIRNIKIAEYYIGEFKNDLYNGYGERIDNLGNNSNGFFINGIFIGKINKKNLKK